MQPDHKDGILLSLVAPAHNEAENLPALVAAIKKAMDSLGHGWEMIVVDDGSTDQTLQVLEGLLSKYPMLRVLRLKSRSGQTAAIDAGLRHARGTYIATLDADMQNDPAEIPRMLQILQTGDWDMVNGWRKERHDPWLRLVSTRIANAVRNRLTNEKIHDSACGLKVFRAACIRRICLFNGMHRFLPTLFRLAGFKVIEVPVRHHPRQAGKAKYGVWNRIFRAFYDTLAVRWMASRWLRYECTEVTSTMHQSGVRTDA